MIIDANLITILKHNFHGNMDRISTEHCKIMTRLQKMVLGSSIDINKN